MLVAAAFANAGDADKVARALSRYGLRALPAISGAQLLRQSASITLVVCGPRLQDMTARRLRQLLPPSIPMLMMAAGETPLPGIELLPRGVTKSQLAERVLQTLGSREATVARAKRILIRHGCPDEASAHRLLQTRAMNTGCTLLTAAHQVLTESKQENDRSSQ